MTRKDIVASLIAQINNVPVNKKVFIDNLNAYTVKLKNGKFVLYNSKMMPVLTLTLLIKFSLKERLRGQRQTKLTIS